MNWVAVFIGGGLGSLLRYAVGLYFKSNSQDFPWSTFIANIFSCFIAGLVLGLIQKNYLPDTSRALLISGFCGGFSTFSALSVESLALWQSENYLVLGVYIIASIVSGIVMVLIGNSFAHFL